MVTICLFAVCLICMRRRKRFIRDPRQSRRRKKKRTQSNSKNKENCSRQKKYQESPLEDPLDNEDDDDYWASKKRSLDRQARTESASYNSTSMNTSSRFQKESTNSIQSPSHHVVLNIPVLRERQERVPSYSDDSGHSGDRRSTEPAIHDDEEKMETEISPQSTITAQSTTSPHRVDSESPAIESVQNSGMLWIESEGIFRIWN